MSGESGPVAATSVFVCYRRDDSGDVAGRIFDRLCADLGEAAIFKDVDSIPFGVDFREHIHKSLATARVVLVLIGPEWLMMRDARKRRRLDDPADHVRIEIEQALARPELRVIPLLVGGAHMPPFDRLPEKMRELHFRNGAAVRRDPDFRRDMERLIYQIRPLLAEAASAPPAEPAPGVPPPTPSAIGQVDPAKAAAAPPRPKEEKPAGTESKKPEVEKLAAVEKRAAAPAEVKPAPKVEAPPKPPLQPTPPGPKPAPASFSGALAGLIKFALSIAALVGLNVAIRYFTKKPEATNKFPEMPKLSPLPSGGASLFPPKPPGELPNGGLTSVDMEFIKKLSPFIGQPLQSMGANSLGMTFVSVGEVQFAQKPVTVRAYQQFAESTNFPSKEWKNPGFLQTPEDPVVNVSWDDAMAFCNWLTDREKKSGALKGTERYRLPSDFEWSQAVGLKVPKPYETAQIDDSYPWGKQWPPPPGTGNFAGDETQLAPRLIGYRDTYVHTSPVGSFTIEANGLYDMSGNVLQWVSPALISSNLYKNLRGSSWASGTAIELKSAANTFSFPGDRKNTYGFRVVRTKDGK